ncbi:MAG: stage III sporulation protein AE, partial [Clostridia bacterium]
MPLIKILATSVLYRFAAGVAEPATDKRIVRLLMDLAGNITLIFAILLMVMVMFVISIALLCSLGV